MSASKEDVLPLLVGKIILAFGRLDQEIQTQIHWFEKDKTRDESQRERIDGRFSHRTKQFRRHLVRLTADKSPEVRRYDKAIGAVAKAVEIRGRLTHGRVVSKGDAVAVADVGGLQKWYDEIGKKVGLPGMRHVIVQYTAAELVQAADDLETAQLEVSLIGAEIYRPRSQPTH
jgi:hypothetical protein